MDTSFHGIAASPWYRETASILCPPCPRTAVHHLPGLYTPGGRGFLSPSPSGHGYLHNSSTLMILKKPSNRTATPNCHSRPRSSRGQAPAGMTIYSRCVDTHDSQEKFIRLSDLFPNIIQHQADKNTGAEPIVI